MPNHPKGKDGGLVTEEISEENEHQMEQGKEVTFIDPLDEDDCDSKDVDADAEVSFIKNVTKVKCLEDSDCNEESKSTDDGEEEVSKSSDGNRVAKERGHDKISRKRPSQKPSIKKLKLERNMSTLEKEEPKVDASTKGSSVSKLYGRGYLCVQCGKSFMLRKDWNKHLVLHSSQFYFSCSLCHTAFADIKALKQHIQDKHGSVAQGVAEGNESQARGDKDVTSSDSESKAKVLEERSKHAGISDFAGETKEEDGSDPDPMTKNVNTTSDATEARGRGRGRKKKSEVHEQKVKEALVCSECGYTCFIKSDLKRHHMTHSHLLPYECNICGSKFKRDDYLRNHVRTHVEVSMPFLCPHCPYSCRRNDQLKVHINKHFKTNKKGRATNNRVARSSSRKNGPGKDNHKKDNSNAENEVDKSGDLSKRCGEENKPEVEKANKEVVNSRWKYFGEKTLRAPYQCDMCTYECFSLADMSRHKETHSDLRKYQCDTCGKTFKRDDYLRNHMRSHAEKPVLKCQLCPYTCLISYHLTLHMKKHNPDRHNHQCPQCPFKASSKPGLIGHMRVHTNQPKVVDLNCKVCNVLFKTKRSLQYHMRRHSNKTPYTCIRCDAKFSSCSGYHDHIKRHKGLKAFCCSECGLSFFKSSALKRHQLIHADLKPYCCDSCSFATRWKNNLTQHMLTHTGEKVVRKSRKHPLAQKTKQVEDGVPGTALSVHTQGNSVDLWQPQPQAQTNLPSVMSETAGHTPALEPHSRDISSLITTEEGHTNDVAIVHEAATTVIDRLTAHTNSTFLDPGFKDSDSLCYRASDLPLVQAAQRGGFGLLTYASSLNSSAWLAQQKGNQFTNQTPNISDRECREQTAYTFQNRETEEDEGIREKYDSYGNNFVFTGSGEACMNHSAGAAGVQPHGTLSVEGDKLVTCPSQTLNHNKYLDIYQGYVESYDHLNIYTARGMVRQRQPYKKNSKSETGTDTQAVSEDASEYLVSVDNKEKVPNSAEANNSGVFGDAVVSVLNNTDSLSLSILDHGKTVGSRASEVVGGGENNSDKPHYSFNNGASETKPSFETSVESRTIEPFKLNVEATVGVDAGIVEKELNYNNAATKDCPKGASDKSFTSGKDRDANNDSIDSELPMAKLKKGRKNKLSVRRCKKGVEPLLCRQCSYTSHYKADMARHEEIHSDTTPYLCSICGKGFKRVDYLNIHVRRHSNIRPKRKPRLIPCAECSTVFCSKFDLNKHIKSEHRKEENVIHCCDLCQEIFTTKRRLKYHQERHNNATPFTCDKCGAKFRSKSGLTGHLTKHEIEDGKLILQCEPCGQVFSSKKALEYHNARHRNERPFACDQCGATFRSKSGLNDHMLRHDGVKPCVCNICGMSFITTSKLRKHKLVHSDAKPHVCKFCSFSTRWRDNLRQHMLIHQGQKQRPRKKRQEQDTYSETCLKPTPWDQHKVLISNELDINRIQGI